MPQVMAAPDIVKGAGEPALGDLGRVDAGADQVDGEALGDRGVEGPGPGGAAREVELQDGREAGRGQRRVEDDAGPGHVAAVEGRVPGEDDAADAEGRGQRHVDPARDGLAVEGRVLGRHDGGGDEERDARVVDAGEALHERLVGHRVHRVPHGAADQALAGREEEDGRDADVGVGAEAEVRRRRVEVEGDGQHDHQPDGVGPDVDQLVRDAEHGPHALDLGRAEAVPPDDVRVDTPGDRQVFVPDEPILTSALDGRFDVLLHRLGGLHGSLDPLVHHLPGPPNALIHHAPASIHEAARGARKTLLPHLGGAGLKVGQDAVQQADADVDLLAHGLLGRERILIPRLDRLDHDPSPPPPGADHLARDLTAPGSHGLQRSIRPADPRVQVEIPIVLEDVQPPLQFREEDIHLRRNRRLAFILPYHLIHFHPCSPPLFPCETPAGWR